MKTTAVSNGAATLVNAIATGRGAAYGIGLKTKAIIKLNDSGIISATIRNSNDECTDLIEICVKKVFNYYGKDFGAELITESNIPIARGLKSSSTAANAAVLAAAHAVVKEDPRLQIPDDITLINLGIDAAIDADVTITGALDDAAASFFGGWVVTDNKQRKIIKSSVMEELYVLLFVPDNKTYTRDVDVKRTKILSKGVDLAWNKALDANIYSALTLNGLVYSLTLGYNPDIALAAIKAGALGAGLCGTGPAVSALIKNDPDKVKDVWNEFNGNIIESNINNKKARIIK